MAVEAAVQAVTVALSGASKLAICHQIRLNRKRKTCRCMSVPFFALALLSYGAWTVDGVTGGGWSLVWGQGPGLALCLVIAGQAWWYDRDRGRVEPWL